MTSFRLLKSFL